MNTKTRIVTLLCTLAFACTLANASPYFRIDSLDEWIEVRPPFLPDMNRVEPLDRTEWDEYMMQWNAASTEREGDPYPIVNFLPAELYPHDGSPIDGVPLDGDEGLIMAWGDDSLPEDNWASAWKLTYAIDPDLSNAIITIGVNPPSGAGINIVSFGIRDAAGNIKSWYWNCGPGGLPQNVTTVITIDPSGTGVGATTPVASSYMNAGCNITQAMDFIVDENSAWVGGPTPIVPLGGTYAGRLWNYWTNLTVMPKNVGAYKGCYVKFSQPPVEIEPGVILGWDEQSLWNPDVPPIMADDWLCKDPRPVTDFHWWGSFIGWSQPHLPPVVPVAFQLGIWTDVPAGVDRPWSHPGELIWQHRCDNWVWNYAGVDRHPDPEHDPIFDGETCFQFNQLLSEEDYFWQDPITPDGTEGNIYWLSIAAVYPAGTEVAYPWGWKTRPKENPELGWDDAVRIRVTNPWLPVIVPGTPPPKFIDGDPVFWPTEAESWDLCFELTTTEPAYEDDPTPGDVNADHVVNLIDFAILANNWLTVVP